MNTAHNVVYLNKSYRQESKMDLSELRIEAVVLQMAYYLASYYEECDIDGYFIYIPEEQSCIFMRDYDKRHYLHTLSIPIHEFVYNGGLQLIPNGDGYRPDIRLGNLSSIIETLREYIS